MNGQLKIRAQYAPWYNGVEVLIETDTHYGTITYHEHESDRGVCKLSPTIRISKESAQILMDDLWASGIRPTEGMGSAGSLRATEKHLNDMRKIVGSQLKVEL